MPRCPECNYPLIRGYARLVCKSCQKRWQEEFIRGYLKGIEDTQEMIADFSEKMRN